MRLLYRLRQLRDNLIAGPLPVVTTSEIAAWLCEAELQLFRRFTDADQRHSYRVLRTLVDAGYNHPDLLAAALLHDVGKTACPLSARDRTVIVVGGALFPSRSKEWGRGPLDSWRRPFVVRACHPHWGAEMAVKAGSRPGVIELIQRHQDSLESSLSALTEAKRHDCLTYSSRLSFFSFPPNHPPRN